LGLFRESNNLIGNK
jgi:hypothetical protein